MKWMAIVLLMFLIAGCNSNQSKMEVKEIISPDYSDTLFPFVVNLLEKSDNGFVEYRQRPKYMRFFEKELTNNSNDSISSVKIAWPYFFIDLFHDSLDLASKEIRDLADSIFGKNLQTRYMNLNHRIDVSAFPQINFISKDSIEKLSRFEDSNFRDITYLSFSLPIYSEDSNFLFFEVSKFSYTGGSEVTYIFYKEKNQWSLFRRIQRRFYCG